MLRSQFAHASGPGAGTSTLDLALERRCCPFLSFELHWKQGDDAAPWLRLTGPEGTKAFLEAAVPSLRAPSRQRAQLR